MKARHVRAQRIALAVVALLGLYAAFFGLVPIPKESLHIVVAPEKLAAKAENPLESDGRSFAAGAHIVGMPGTAKIVGDGQRHSIASITKVLTALVILEKHPLAAGQSGPTLTLTAADAQFVHDHIVLDSVNIPHQAGDRFTQRELLEQLIVVSAGNVGDTLAVWAYGSKAAYLQATAQYLEKHGMRSTQIVDASGISHDNQSTVSDLLTLGDLAFKNDTVREIMGLPAITVKGQQYRSRIALLGQDGVIGGKTGTAEVDALTNLMVLAKHRAQSAEIPVVVVSLNHTDTRQTAEITRKALQAYTAEMRPRTVLAEGSEVGYLQVPWLGNTRKRVYTAQDLTVATAPGANVDLQQLPGDVSTRLREPGALEIKSLDGTTSRAQLTIRGAEIPEPDFFWRMTHPLDIARMLIGGDCNCYVE